MKHLQFIVAKNATANLVRGCATAVVALALPHFLTRSLDHDRFAAWSLMLQVAAYANYLDFGLQTAVARYLARYMERGEEDKRNWLASTALALLSLAALVGAVVMVLVLWQTPHLFRGVPHSLLSEFRWAVAVLGCSTAILLPFSTYSGILIGLHRNEHVALAVGGSRLIGAVAVLALVRHTDSLIVLAICISVANLLGGILQVLIVKRLLPSLHFSLAGVRTAMVKELAKYCGGLTVWSLSMFLVSGISVTLVGYFDFKAVGYYSLAMSLVVFYVGVSGTVSNALLAPVSALHAAGDPSRIRTLILTATRLNTFVNIVVAVAMFLFGPVLLRAWVGQEYASRALPIFEILIVANAIRMTCMPYAWMLIATGQQKYGIVQGMVEGLVNCGSSVVLAVWLGPIGIAWGAVIGAICAVTWNCTLTMKWARDPSLDRFDFFFESIFRPLACSLPLIFGVAATFHHPVSSTTINLLVACLLATLALTGHFGRVFPGGSWARPGVGNKVQESSLP